MWGFAGPQWSVDDNEYLSEIAQASRRLAEQVMEGELERITTVRLWLWRLLEHYTWWGHPAHCQCPLENESDPQVRVRAMARTVKEYLNAQAEGAGMSVYAWLKQYDPEGLDYESDRDGPSKFAEEVATVALSSDYLTHHINQARDEVTIERLERQRKKRRFVARLMDIPVSPEQD